MEDIKQYKIKEKIGSGGMGAVYKASDTILERDVAIKVIHPSLSENEESGLRLMQEARAAAKLVHPNVVTIYEVGEDKCGRYIVMEYVEGQTLDKTIVTENLLSLPDAISVTIQIADGLGAAHKKDVVHRDIKASNIL